MIQIISLEWPRCGVFKIIYSYFHFIQRCVTSAAEIASLMLDVSYLFAIPPQKSKCLMVYLTVNSVVRIMTSADVVETNLRIYRRECSWSLGRDSNPRSRVYEAAVLTTRPCLPIWCFRVILKGHLPLTCVHELKLRGWAFALNTMLSARHTEVDTMWVLCRLATGGVNSEGCWQPRQHIQHVDPWYTGRNTSRRGRERDAFLTRSKLTVSASPNISYLKLHDWFLIGNSDLH